MKRIPLLSLLVVPLAFGEPIPPSELPRPERTEPSVDRSSLHPSVFEVDFYRLGLEGGLTSPLIRYDAKVAPLVEQSLLRAAFEQVQELQAAGGRARPAQPEDGDVREDLSPSPKRATDASPAVAWSTRGNTSPEGQALFLGTTSKSPIEIGANGTPFLRIEPTPFAPNLVGGAPANGLDAAVVGAVIAGGGDPYLPNKVTSDFSTIGGGVANLAGGENKFLEAPFSTIGGGRGNRVERRHGTIAGGINNLVTGNSGAVAGGNGNVAQGDYSVATGGSENRADDRHATVSGGHKNAAGSEASTVGGGEDNLASGVGATISGGANHRARGAHATIPGGVGNEASGNRSFAAGTQARALHEGAFVWADGTQAPFASTGPHQVLLRAAGNVGIDTASPREKLTVEGNVAPASDDRHHLGTDALRWRDVKLSGAVDYVGHLTFSDQGKPRMRLDEQGNLHVSGQVYSRAFEGRDPSNVGIAAPAPSPGARDHRAELRALASRLEQLEAQPMVPPQSFEQVVSRLTNLESRPAPTPAPAESPVLAQLAQRLQALEAAESAPRVAPEELAVLSRRFADLEARPVPDAAEVLALTKRLAELEARPAPEPTPTVSPAEFTAVEQRLVALERKPASVPVPPSELAALNKRLAELEAQPTVDPKALQALGVRLQALEATPRTGPPSESLAKALAIRVDQLEARPVPDATEVLALTKRLAELEARPAPEPTPTVSPAEFTAVEQRLVALERKPASVPVPPAELAALNKRLAELEAQPTVDPKALQALGVRLQALEATPRTGPPSESLAKALAIRVDQLEARPAAVTKAELVELQALVDTLRATPSATKAEVQALQQRFQDVVVARQSEMQPLLNRIINLEQTLTRPAPAPEGASVNTGMVAVLQDRLDLAVTSISQRQSVSEQNMVSLRNQVAQARDANEAMGLQWASLQQELDPLKTRLAAVEKQVPGPAPATAPQLAALQLQQQEHARHLENLLSATPELAALKQEQVRLARAHQAKVDRGALEILEAKIQALSRQVIAMEQAASAPASAPGAIPGGLVDLRQQVTEANHQIAIAKRERAALQRDQLRLLSLEKKVRTLSQPAVPPAGVPAPATGASVASPRLPRSGSGAKNAEVMTVLGNLIGLQMREYQTARGTGIGPEPAAFNTTFGSRAPANTIDSELAEGVALTAIQGLFEILEAQDRRIIELEKKLAKVP